MEETNFTSWRENSLKKRSFSSNERTEAEDILIEDEYISSLMNQDGILQIGEYLFKINVNQELVYALHESNKRHYNDLVGENEESKKIMIFSTNDDVLPLLSEGSTGTIKNARETGLTCKQSQAAAENESYDFYFGQGDGYRIRTVVRYVKLGVYFKLMAKMRNQMKAGPIWVTQESVLRIYTDAGWKPRCRSTSYRNDETSAIDHSHKRVVYEKIKGLNKYYYKAQFNNATAGIITDVIEIRDNW
ncbi:MAG: hypothetical protein ACLFQ0_18030 [Cyclobacteriaceae bacterium]